MIHSINKRVLNTYHMPGNVLKHSFPYKNEDILEMKKDKTDFAHMNLPARWERKMFIKLSPATACHHFCLNL